MASQKNIIMGLDISTSCIGICILEDDGTDNGKILELTHVNPKTPRKVSGIEALCIKKQIFNDEFLSKWVDFGITRVIIESPLLSSNNVNTVATLLQFNGLISDCVYNTLHIVPEYISSYEARKYAFPSLIAVRKFDKKGEPYPKDRIKRALEKNQLVLFGSYEWQIDKKGVIMGKVNDISPDIDWLTDKNGEFRKENFDSCDALVACLGVLHKDRNGEIELKKDKIKEELADVINYCVLMADACNLDIDQIVQDKIKKNNEKYPVEKAKGKSEKYSEL